MPAIAPGQRKKKTTATRKKRVEKAAASALVSAPATTTRKKRVEKAAASGLKTNWRKAAATPRTEARKKRDQELQYLASTKSRLDRNRRTMQKTGEKKPFIESARKYGNAKANFMPKRGTPPPAPRSRKGPK